MNLKEREVRRCAGEVLTELGIATPPIDPFAIAAAKEIQVQLASGFPPEVYGAMYLDASGFGIVISRGCHGDGHRAFTAAHELGHYHCEGHVDAMFPAGHGQVLSMAGHFRDSKNAHEREADWFASELLMPGRWTLSRVRSHAPTLEAVYQLADEFQVSLCCAAIRYVELTDQAASVVVSKGGQIEWAAFSGRLKEHRWSRSAARRDWVPRNTATRRLAEAGSRVARAEEDGSSGMLCEWFDGAPEFVRVEEEAVGLGSYGRVLTVLSIDDLPTVDELSEEEHSRSWRERDWRDAMRGYGLD